MSTPLTDRITGLTAQANAVTGASDTTLTDAVGRLIGGYKDGVDVIISDIPFTDVTGFAEYLFGKINGENGVIYTAVLTKALTPNMHQQMADLVFQKQSSGIVVGGMRIVNSGGIGGYYLATSTNLAKATIGDIYTVYTL